MGFFEMFLLAVGLSMDAFAVSVCKGLSMKKAGAREGVICGAWFGGFQALMPVIGFFLGTLFADAIEAFDHWIAFILLAIIGGKMIWEVIKGEEDGCETCGEDKLDLKQLLVMAIATSIDALAVGITFAFLRVNIVPAVSLIGITTFVLSFIGVAIGNRFGSKYKSKAELAGGIVLVLIGLKILLEHLGIM